MFEHLNTIIDIYLGVEEKEYEEAERKKYKQRE